MLNIVHTLRSFETLQRLALDFDAELLLRAWTRHSLSSAFVTRKVFIAIGITALWMYNFDMKNLVDMLAQILFILVDAVGFFRVSNL